MTSIRVSWEVELDKGHVAEQQPTEGLKQLRHLDVIPFAWKKLGSGFSVEREDRNQKNPRRSLKHDKEGHHQSGIRGC